TNGNLSFEAFKALVETHPLLKNSVFKLSLYNEEAIVHKLSHQHLYTKFWIVNMDGSLEKGISTEKIHQYPVPILIGNFMEQFNF
ncbi:MAG TPA: A/G-specific adenine glycosylase, partial [Mariniflexile sp.]|nr:A/G-specific adenine glycosylase [Mariniflexile sp.]